MYQLTPSRERSLLWLLALTQFTVIMDFMIMMPLGPQIMHKFAIGPSMFATAVSVYAWCSGLSSLLAATYIDRYDRRRLMLVTYALFALSNLGCALAPTFELLLLARAFAGLTGGVLGATVMAIVADIVPIQRRGAATGIIMTAFSMASVAGVPAGVVLGATFGWSSPFILLVMLSVLIWVCCQRLVPTLAAHLEKQPPALAEVLPDLFRLIRTHRYLRAFALTFAAMSASMLIVPFIAPVLVANYGVAPKQLSWIYMAGGAATFFTARLIGQLTDRFGKHLTFRVLGVLSVVPILILTHLPAIPFLVMIPFCALFMVLVSGRIVPLQALMTTLPEAQQRGAFLSVNSSIQSLATGCGAWVGGLLLSTDSSGHIIGYGNNGWVATGLITLSLLWVGQVRAESAASTTLLPMK